MAALLSLWWLGTIAYAQSAPSVSARRMGDFGRITTSWASKPGFRASSSGNTITIRFDKPGAMKLGSVTGALAPYVTAANLSADQKTITLTTRQPYRIRQFISGNQVGIDILGLNEAAAAAETPKPPPPKSTEAAMAEAQPTAPAPAPLPTAKPPAPKPTPVKLITPKKAEKPAPKPQEAKNPPVSRPKVVQVEKEETKKEPAAEKAATKPAEEITQDEVAKTEAAATANKLETPVEPPQPAPVAKLAPKPEPVAEEVIAEKPLEKPAPAAEPAAKTIPAQADGFMIGSKPLATGVELEFPFTERTAAAVFRRGNSIFVIFNRAVNAKPALLKSVLPPSVTSLTALDVPNHTVLHFKTDGSLHPSATRPSNESQRWLVNLSQFRAAPTRPLALELDSSGQRPSAMVAVLEHSAPLSIKDPAIGDQITAVPFFVTSQGISPARSFVDFDMLETAQGMAVVPKSDGVQVSEPLGGIRIGRENGLRLSADLPELTAEDEANAGAASSTFFPYERWKIAPGSYSDVRARLEREISLANGIKRSATQLKLAETFLGEGLAIEALGVLNRLRLEDPGFYAERRAGALRGAANFMLYRFGESGADFSSSEFSGSTEAEFWREAIALFTGSLDKVKFDYVTLYEPYIRLYPPALKRRLAVIAADNYINRARYNKAMATFDTLKEDAEAQTGATSLYIEYLIGRIAMARGKVDDAISIWQPLAEQHTNALVRARAEYSLVLAQYQNNKISLEEATARLERLRLIWRGDELELAVVNYLGQLYLADKQYLNAMRAWKEVTLLAPQSNDALDAAQRMAETFRMLYLDGGADELPPLEALALFEEFRNQVPVGPDGDKMVENIADRLAAVDLLDQAAALLETQIRTRVEGEERSRAGARLALIHLLNQDAKSAIRSLELTNYGNNPESLRLQRAHIASMALLEDGQTDRALTVLDQDTSRDGELLRLNIYWNTQNWLRVIDSGETLLSARDDITAQLNEEETDILLKLALAYAFQRDYTQLSYLQSYFGQLLPKDSKKAEMFNFITAASDGIDPAKFAEFGAQIGQMESFLQKMRSQVEQGNLSEAVQ